MLSRLFWPTPSPESLSLTNAFSLCLSHPLSLSRTDMCAVSNTQNHAHSRINAITNSFSLYLSCTHPRSPLVITRAHTRFRSLLRAHKLTHLHAHTKTNLSLTHPDTQLVRETGRLTKQGFNTQVSYPSRRFLTHGVTSSLPTRSAPATPFPFPCSLQGLQSRTTLKS